MTIVSRNKFLITSIVLSALLFVISLACTVTLYVTNTVGKLPLPYYRIISFAGITISMYNNDAVTFGILSFSLIACLLLAGIFFLFEKTHAIEMSFFALFLFALSFESLRLYFPLSYLHPLALIGVLPIMRTIFFFRFFAFLSLLTASLFTHKVFTRNTMSIIFLLCFISFALAQTLPCNPVYAANYFTFSQQYQHIFTGYSTMIALLSVLSLFVTGITRDIPEYRKAAMSLLIVLGGYGVLIYTNTWIAIITGIMVFFLGTVLFIRHIHRFYLWQ